ncbi:MAG TPA: hypothetical protein VHY30_02250 [Verrucomicrobiae bacterium]|nr:hypothetical protein [Verrucomicrobiae bacterium]
MRLAALFQPGETCAKNREPRGWVQILLPGGDARKNRSGFCGSVLRTPGKTNQYPARIIRKKEIEKLSLRLKTRIVRAGFTTGLRDGRLAQVFQFFMFVKTGIGWFFWKPFTNVFPVEFYGYQWQANPCANDCPQHEGKNYSLPPRHQIPKRFKRIKIHNTHRKTSKTSPQSYGLVNSPCPAITKE